MLHSFQIQNFKAFGDPQTLPLRPITIIFGPNSAGKSSLLHAFVFSQQNLSTGESDIQSIPSGDVDLGGFGQFVHCQDLTKPVSWTTGLTISEDEENVAFFERLGVKPESLSLKVENHFSASADGSSPQNNFAVSFTIFVNGEPLFRSGSYRPKDLNRQAPRQDIVFENAWLKAASAAGAGAIAAQAGPAGFAIGTAGLSTALFAGLGALPLLAPVAAGVAGLGVLYELRTRLQKKGNSNQSSRPSQEETIAGLLLRYCIDQVANFEKTVYIGPLRHYPNRNLNFDAADPQQDAWKLVATNQGIRDKVNNWIGRDGPLQTPYRIDLNGEGTASMRITDLRTGARVTPRDIGFGMSQVMPILVHAFQDTGKVVLVEQPEVHLHPRLQAELADLFIEGASRNQATRFVLETHSEAMILRFLRRIRETTQGKFSDQRRLSKEDVALVYVEPTECGALLREIRVDEFGRLRDTVPGGFFEETTWEMF